MDKIETIKKLNTKNLLRFTKQNVEDFMVVDIGVVVGVVK
jgi:hypothetical protein